MLTFEGLTAAIGPASDALHVPMRITGGTATGMGVQRQIICGTDVAVMYADEKLVHNGNSVIADPAGDIIVWYDGPSQAVEGAYDDLLDGGLPGTSPCRRRLPVVSTSPEWRVLDRRPLLGIGTFDGSARTLHFTPLSVIDSSTVN